MFKNLHQSLSRTLEAASRTASRLSQSEKEVSFQKLRHFLNLLLLLWTGFPLILYLLSLCYLALYRINYDEENWKLLTKSFRTLPEITRVQVLTDSFAMANAGLLGKRIMWNILEKVEAESGEILWTPTLHLLTTIQRRFWDSDLFKVTFGAAKAIFKRYAFLHNIHIIKCN